MNNETPDESEAGTAAPADSIPATTPAAIPIGVPPAAPASDYAPAAGFEPAYVAETVVEAPVSVRRNVILFLLTVATTSYWGFLQYQSFYLDDVGVLVFNPFAEPMLWIAGLPYGMAVIAFLAAHEMGHYLACRYYGIRATLPYFIPIPPIPPILLPGTMGAVIRIKSPITGRRALFDIAVAGPLAGFVAAMPLLAVGLGQSRVIESDSLGFGIGLGEPLIWGPLQAMFAPPLGPGQTLLAHPLAFVGWFALLVTAMNLLPIGQLDGGHLLYAVTPRHHRKVSVLLVVLMLFAGYQYFSGWILFALLILFALGTKHPRPLSFEGSLGPVRQTLLLISILILVTSFMLEPIRIDFPL
jgi:membrane-associated protease RseP (regulator of RpoE activity)